MHINEQIKSEYPIYKGILYQCCYCHTMFISQQFLEKHQLKCINLKIYSLLKEKLKLKPKREVTRSLDHKILKKAKFKKQNEMYFYRSNEETSGGGSENSFLLSGNMNSPQDDENENQLNFLPEDYDFASEYRTSRQKNILNFVSALEYNNQECEKLSHSKTHYKKKIAKHLRNSGQEYISSSKTRKIVEAKKLLPPCSTKCRLKCFNKFSDHDRNQIFYNYWQLGDIEMQRAFIAGNIEHIKRQHRYLDKQIKRQLNHAFYFYNCEQKIRVCKLFFCNTLGISERPIRTVLEKMTHGITFEDRRGKHPHRKVEYKQ